MARGPPSSADFSPAACCVGRSVRDQGWWPGARRAQPLVIMCPANPRARNACSDWIQHLSADQSTPRAEFKFFFSGYVTKLEKSRNIQQNSKVFSSSQHTVTWWTDYVFEQSMNMKHPSRFNPALLSHSTRPNQIFVASSPGWAYRSIRMNILSLWRRALTGRSLACTDIRQEISGSTGAKLKVTDLIFICCRYLSFYYRAFICFIPALCHLPRASLLPCSLASSISPSISGVHLLTQLAPVVMVPLC